ncbi:MAG: SH3 domain-containing protein [Chloroflexi bacterium]|nr:SH3 domain-containing protein [Chloroflexota bacterium]
MPGRKLFLVITVCLNIIFTACNFQGISQKPDELNAVHEIELTGTALAASGVLETPDFTLFTPTTVSITSTPDATPIFTDHLPLAVVMIKENEVLSLRSSPGENNHEIASLSSLAGNIVSKGNTQDFEGESWVEIQSPKGETGWVKIGNLTEQVSSMEFCSDQRVTQLVDKFMNAIRVRNGKEFAQLISPRRGLIIRHEWWNPEVNFREPEMLENIFNDSTTNNWGIENGSGQSINGSFKDVILPKIDDVQEGSIRLCNSLEQGLASGGSAGFIRWPNEYANFNYITIYRAAPEGDELNWRTWVIGIEYVHGSPYIAILVQYHWEI